MARTRSTRVQNIKNKLIIRIRSGYYRAGERFFSNRAIAQYFAVSYQTAHRIMRELEQEGWIERREYSGSFVAGLSEPIRRVCLCFSSRANRPLSFGDRIIRLLTAHLDKTGIPWNKCNHPEQISSDSLPIIWEYPELLNSLSANRRFAVLVNARPPVGIIKSHIDSVSVDDYSGGVSAAHLILTRVSRASEITVLQGPPQDNRNRERVEGFLSVLPRATVFTAGSWDYEKGYETAVQVAANEPRAVFCTNDRIASAFIQYYKDIGRTLPGVVGFDNAPVSEQIDLTTIAIPWDQMIQTIVKIAERRISGDTQTSIQYVLNTVPIIRCNFFHE